MNNRNIGIDFLKFFAALLITHSHMDLLYVKYGFLATGGSIGDSIFFFCSGFTLFMKPFNDIRQFPNWYKKRINRIYPSIFAVAVLSCLFFDSHRDIIDIILNGGGWFVTCIMLYYLLLYPIGTYMRDKIYLIMGIVAVAGAVWFYNVYQTPEFNMFGDHYIRWVVYFIYMLMGAQMGMIQDKIKSKPTQDVILLILSIIVFYGIYISSRHFSALAICQYLSFIPLMAVVYYFYKVSISSTVKRIYESKVGNFLIRVIGGLCLEIYVIQIYLITDKMNHLFPFNIVIMILTIIVAAYFTRCVSRFISQTFNDAPYDWKKIISLYQ